MDELIERWKSRQVFYEDLAEKNRDTNNHNYKKFTYQAKATRDCWKELIQKIEDNSSELDSPKIICDTYDLAYPKANLFIKNADEKFKNIINNLTDDELETLRDRFADFYMQSTKNLNNDTKCYHYNHEWKSNGQGGNLKYCNDCKCYV